MIWAVIFLAGVLVGFAIPSWWALLAPLAFGIYITVVTPVEEVPHIVLGSMYGIWAAAAVSVGVVARRRQ